MYLPNEKYFSLHFHSFFFSILLSFISIFVFGNPWFFLCLEAYYCYHNYRRKDSSRWYFFSLFSVILLGLCFYFSPLLVVYRMVLFGKVIYYLFEKLLPSAKHRLQERLYYPLLDGNHLESFVFFFHGPKIFFEEYQSLTKVPFFKERFSFARSITKQRLLSLRKTYELCGYGSNRKRTVLGEESFCSFDFFYLLMNFCFYY